jgi:RND superfamily putative drug exporter
MTDTSTKHAMPQPKRPLIPHTIRLLAVPIILFCVFVAVLVNTIAPKLELVGDAHS